MTACEGCGREPENGRPTHWLGCDEITEQDFEDKKVHADPVVICEYDECSEPKKPWLGRGAKPKFCQKHSDPKNRK
ncbi:hypothetical protein [Streptomyces rochei]|uniref:hypothetical protein n=1 Tax=Streptomyces rochei TaxID=1928 RepID=UPI0036FE0BE9